MCLFATFHPLSIVSQHRANTTKIITQHFKCHAITQTLFVNSERVETSSTLTLWTASWYKDKTQTNKAAADGDKPLRTTKGQKGTKMEIFALCATSTAPSGTLAVPKQSSGAWPRAQRLK